ncbi:MAG: 4Fe-4S ferredoxin [Dehalococcoidia bacterium]|nr:4Fe-4S ferredoxin [Dehalococcoidia bacterium]
MTTEQSNFPKWSMAVDTDRCTGCQACIIACQEENNIPLNTPDIFKQRRAVVWIRVERYWELPEGEDADDPSKVKARFLPLMCQHCDNAPCEPVCPVYATYHNMEGLNVQIYNRCIGTRYCANNDPYNVRFFNFWQPVWPESMQNQLNPDVSIRSRGVMEKCTFCVQRIRRGERTAKFQGRRVKDGEIQPACVQTCPTNALVFGDINDPESKVHKLKEHPRHYRLLADLGTGPNVIYLARVDPNAVEKPGHE